MRWAATCLLAAGCGTTALQVTSKDEDGGAEAPSGAALGFAAPADAEGEREGSTSDAQVEAAVDAGKDEVDAAKDAEAEASYDAGVQDASIADAHDAAIGVDAGWCLDYVQAPYTPDWVVGVHFFYNTNTSTLRSYSQICPDQFKGGECYNEFKKRGELTPYGWRMFPFNSCTLDVPAPCLPCTGGQTQW